MFFQFGVGIEELIEGIGCDFEEIFADNFGVIHELREGGLRFSLIGGCLG